MLVFDCKNTKLNLKSWWIAQIELTLQSQTSKGVGKMLNQINKPASLWQPKSDYSVTAARATLIIQL